jgi:hypothetical protein
MEGKFFSETSVIFLTVKLLLALASIVIPGSESHGTHDHIFYCLMALGAYSTDGLTRRYIPEDKTCPNHRREKLEPLKDHVPQSQELEFIALQSTPYWVRIPLKAWMSICVYSVSV